MNRKLSFLSRIAFAFIGLIHLGIAIWASVILTKAAPSEIILAYVATECAIGYLGCIVCLIQAGLNAPNCCKGFIESLGIGMFIWNAVLLFHILGGIPQSPTDPYEYFVFVKFCISIASFAFGIIACCCMCCAFCSILITEEIKPPTVELSEITVS